MTRLLDPDRSARPAPASAAPPTNAAEFFIGWAPVPPALGRWLRRLVVALAALATIVALGLALGLRPTPAGRFEYGDLRDHEGVLHAAPMPLLAAADGTVFLLVAPGKHGADAAIAPFDGHRVRLRGALIVRDGTSMLEIDPASLSDLGSAPPPATRESLGRIALRGEIVDGKCYLGVMVPGQGKTHRDCAVRCLSGGTPALLAWRDGLGREHLLPIAAPDGKPLGPRILDRVAEPVSVSGELVRQAGTVVLLVRPEDVARD